MRAICALLVLLGMLIIALPHIRTSQAEPTPETARLVSPSFPNDWAAVPTIYGWILLVTGSLIIASGGQSDLDEVMERKRPETDAEATPS